MRHHRRVAVRLGQPHGFDRLGERPDLIHLDQDRVADAALDPLLQPLRIGDEEVVADQLNAITELLCQLRPGVPVVLGEPVLDRDDREPFAELGPERWHLSALLLAALEAVDAVVEDLARRRIERDRNALAVARALGRLEDDLDRRLARLEVGREAAFVPDAGREPALFQQLLQRVIDLGADPQTLAERRRADRNDHELLQVDRVGRMSAAVDHVQHRHRQRRRLLATEVAVEGLPRLGSRGLRDRERDTEDRVRAEPPFVRRPVELDQAAVEPGLVGSVQPGHLAVDLGDVRDRLRHALAAPLGTTVAQLDRLVHARRGTGGDNCAPARPGIELDLDLDRRVAARVEDLSALHERDRAHRNCSFASS